MPRRPLSPSAAQHTMLSLFADRESGAVAGHASSYSAEAVHGLECGSGNAVDVWPAVDESAAGQPRGLERKGPGSAHLLARHLPRRAEQPWSIAVEGPLRVGKSTLARLLAERLGATYVPEPEDNPFLARFYAGETGMAFATQMWFLRERLAQREAVARLAGPVVSDYILEKDKLFAFLNLSDSELAVYKDFYAAHALRSAASRPELVVYLQASPAVLLERRRRKGLPEERGIDGAYTEQVCAAYEHFFSRYTGSRLLVVDTSAIDFVDSEHDRELLLRRILAPVHGREHFAPLAQIA